MMMMVHTPYYFILLPFIAHKRCVRNVGLSSIMFNVHVGYALLHVNCLRIELIAVCVCCVTSMEETKKKCFSAAIGWAMYRLFRALRVPLIECKQTN